MNEIEWKKKWDKILAPLKPKPFCYSCGQPWEDDVLEFVMEEAAQQEDYEQAAKCRDELKRRKGVITAQK